MVRMIEVSDPLFINFRITTAATQDLGSFHTAVSVQIKCNTEIQFCQILTKRPRQALVEDF